MVETIHFINPFKKNLYIYIFFENENDPESAPFKLVTKSSKYFLQYLE